MADFLKPGMVQEVEFFHKNKKLVIKIVSGGYNRNKSIVEKAYGWKVAKSFGEAWDKIFGPKPQNLKTKIYVDKASGPDVSVKSTFKNSEKGPILVSAEVIPPGTSKTSVTIGDSRGQSGKVH
jgi:hypothetical protein